MPVVSVSGAEGNPVKRYRWHAIYATGDGIGEHLRTLRKAAIRDREEFLSYQKSCGKEDREGARFFKLIANEMMRIIRSITLAIPYFDHPDKDQEIIRPEMWPVDLAFEMDWVAREILDFYIERGVQRRE